MKSKQPKKQRKRHFKAPLHKRQKKIAARLSKELQKVYKKKTIAVRKGDTVRIVRGDFKSHNDKVTAVDLKKYKLEIKGVNMTKANGEEVPCLISPSNVVITELDVTDEKRKNKLKPLKKK